MQRVRFKKQTDDAKYRKGECVSFDEPTAERLVKEGFAERIDGPVSVGDELRPAKEMRRVKFLSGVSDSGKPLFAAGEIRVLPKHEADRFIDNGKAEAFDIASVSSADLKIPESENKMMKPGAVRQKAGV